MASLYQQLTRSLAWIFTLYIIFACLSIFIDPLSSADLYGISLKSEPSDGLAFKYFQVMGGKSIAGGFTALVFGLGRNYRSMGTMLLCYSVSGVVDTTVVGEVGIEGKAIFHGVGTVILGWVGWSLL